MTKARDLASGAPAPAGVTTTELGYVDGVTSAIQTQLNLLDGAQYAGAKNRVLNSNMAIAQRGTSNAISTTVGSSYGVDRWLTYRSVAGSTASQQSSIGLTGIQNALRIQRDSGNTSTATIVCVQNFETVNSIPLAGKTVVFSFYARAGANYSAASGNLAVYLWAGTGTDQKWATYTGQTSPINSTATLTTSWQRFTYSATLASTITELAPAFEFTPVGTAGANDYYEITGVQLEAANTASPYAPNSSTYQNELAACQRYYLKSYAQATAPATASNTVGAFAFAAVNATNTDNRANVRFPVNMRGTPTITVYSSSTGTSAKIFNENTATDLGGAAQFIGESGFHAYVSSGSITGAGTVLIFHYVASAEL